MEKKRLIGCGLGAILVIFGILPPMLGNLQVWDIIVAAIGVGMIAIALNQGKGKKINSSPR